MNLIHVLDRYDTDWYIDLSTSWCFFGAPDSTVSVRREDVERAVGPLIPENE